MQMQNLRRVSVAAVRSSRYRMNFLLGQQWFIWLAALSAIIIFVLYLLRFTRTILKVIAIIVALLWLAAVVGQKYGFVDSRIIDTIREKLLHAVPLDKELLEHGRL